MRERLGHMGPTCSKSVVALVSSLFERWSILHLGDALAPMHSVHPFQSQ